jgi:hypothetical protein
MEEPRRGISPLEVEMGVAVKSSMEGPGEGEVEFSGGKVDRYGESEADDEEDSLA